MRQENVVPKLFKFSHYPKPALDIYTKYILFSILVTIINTVTSTFIVIFVIDIVGIKGLGIILSISFLLTALTDYPTGVLGDWLGYKKVLFMAYVFYGISSLFLAVSTTFNQLIIAYIFLALAEGQASGALQSWFDNKYKTLSQTNDPNKEYYREFLGTTKKYSMIFGSIFFLIGGLLANAFQNGRRLVFLGQSFAMFFAAVLFYLFLDKKENSIIYDTPIESNEKNSESFAKLLVNGLKYTFSSKLISLYLISTILIVATETVWYGVLLFPIYFGYTGSDAGAGSYRWILWLTGAFISVRAGQLAKNLSEKEWLPRLNFLAKFFYFGGTAVITYFIPVENPGLKWAGLFLIYINFASGYYFLNAHVYLKQKLLLEVIPDNMRNSIYSLLPTLSLLFATPLVIFISRLLDRYGYAYTLMIMFFISLLGICFEFIALKHYTPLAKVEMTYDNYMSEVQGKSIQIPRQWYMSDRIKVVYNEFSQIDLCLEDLHENPTLKAKKKSENSAKLSHLHTSEVIYDFMNSLKNYASIFETAHHDGIITEEEMVELSLARNEMLNVIEKIAYRSDRQGDGELVDKIMNLIVDLQQEEKIFNQPIKVNNKRLFLNKLYLRLQHEFS